MIMQALPSHGTRGPYAIPYEEGSAILTSSYLALASLYNGMPAARSDTQRKDAHTSGLDRSCVGSYC